MFDLEKWLEKGGLVVLALIVFAESGLLIGFFLPGDSLLFVAGFLASDAGGNLLPPLPITAGVVFVAAVAVHAPIGLARILEEWLGWPSRASALTAAFFGALLLMLGLRAVWSVVAA